MGSTILVRDKSILDGVTDLMAVWPETPKIRLPQETDMERTYIHIPFGVQTTKRVPALVSFAIFLTSIIGLNSAGIDSIS